MRQVRTLIFDFDGTLADTLGIAIQEIKKFRSGGRPIDDAEIERLRGMTARQVFKSLGIRWWQLPAIVYHGRRIVSEQINEIKTFDGMLAVLQHLRDQGLRMLILSSNGTKNINQVLLNNRMSQYFDNVYGGTGIFDKAAALRKVIRMNNLKIDECMYIGDEMRDVEAARKVGLHSVSVTWGYNNRQALEQAKPETMIDRPEDLLKLFAK